MSKTLQPLKSDYYAPDLLKELQETQLEMLREFDRVCRKHDVHYFLIWGSLLGALRHRGFIPWDDDIDVGIMRDDYEKLRALPQEEWSPGFRLDDPKDDVPQHLQLISKFVKLGTVYETQFRATHMRAKNNPSNLKPPIWIDVVVHDRVKSPEVCRRKYRPISLLFKLYHRAKFQFIPQRKDPPSVFLLSVVNFCLFYLLNIVRKPEVKIAQKIEDVCRSSPGGYIANFYVSRVRNMSPTREEDFFPLREVQFEDLNVWIPKNAEQLLTDIYGDYMKLPPIEKRVGHCAYRLDFGDGLGDRFHPSA
ncbi:MAG: LicD family protein [Thermoguttaceae bacterium]|nr:LicD family protein [Thermoguttaceae bacterium]